MAKLKVEKIKAPSKAVSRETYPALSIERNEDDYVYGVIKDIWFFEDKKFKQKRLGMVVDVFDGRGEVWDAENGQAVHMDNLRGTYTLFFRHTYVLKAFEDKAPADVIDQPVIIYNLGKGDRGYLYKIIIGDAVADYVE